MQVKKLGLIVTNLTFVGELPGAHTIPNVLSYLSLLWPPSWYYYY